MQKALIPVLIALTAVASTMWWRSSRAQSDALARIAALEAERSKWAGAAQPSPESGVPDSHAAEGAAAPQRPQVVRVPAVVDAAGYLKTIDELRVQIGQLSRDLSTARDDAARSTAQTEHVKNGEAVLQASIATLKDDLQAARRTSDAFEAELKAKSERVIRAETAEKITKERLVRAETAAGQAGQSAKEIEELNRRRDGYLNNLMRRFREVNDLYRNFALNAQTRENAGSGLNAGDLSRINAAVQSAEDDLRQLQSLNARAAQLARAK